MATIDQAIAGVEGELQRYSLSLAVEFRKAAQTTQSHLTAEQVETWSREGLAIARNSFRSWEAALEYFKASPAVAQRLGFPSLMDWAGLGRDLSGYSASIAASFFMSSPEALGHIRPTELSVWVGMGRRLYRETWKSALLCGQFFAASAILLRYLSLAELSRFVDYLEMLARLSLDSAIECLAIAQSTFAQIDRRDVGDYINLAMAMGERNWKIVRTYFSDGPRSLSLVGPEDRPLFFAMAQQAVRSSLEEALVFFTESPEHLSAVEDGLKGEMLGLAAGILKRSPPAAREFIRNCPTLLKRLAPQELREWVDIGTSLLEDSGEAGIAFFKLNSSRAGLALQAVSRGAELAEVQDVLRNYGKGLTGKNVYLQSSQDLVDKGIGWAASDKPTTEGNAIYLPPYLDAFETKAQNLEAYKVLTTHQAAHLEFGTFDFSFERPGSLFDNRRAEIEAALASDDRQTITDFERFFDLFKDRRLARDVFTVLEDARVDARVLHEYRGIRRGYGRVQRHSLAKRPRISSLPLRQGILEFLIQASLDGAAPFSVPYLFAGWFAAATAPLRRVQQAGASVEDTAEATLRVYAILRSLPNLLPAREELIDLRLSELDGDAIPLGVQDFVSVDSKAELEGAAESYASPESVDYRGELKPELVQTMMKLRQDGHDNGEMEGFPIPPELLRELLAKSLDIEIMDMVQGDIDESSGLFISNLMKEYGRVKASKSAKKTEKKARKENADEYEEMVEDDGGVSYYYDEWDFRASDYRPNWCRLKERVMQEGAADFFDKTLREHAGLANDVKRQFEMLRPEQFKKLKRLEDGEEFEIDHVVEHVVEKKAGRSPTDKVYWRKNKLERDIAVAVLLDMSASTDEEIEEPDTSASDWWDDNWVFQRRFGQPWLLPFPSRERGKRIIDVEKESLVLLIRALEAIGDRYGIYGFSGYGRDNVEFFVVKNLGEEFGDQIKRRIDKIAPVRGTRMGPAIRHCTSKLEDVSARVRLLILLSDGRPQDHDYGKDRTEKEYAIHDTKMALLEAKRKNIVPFCLTVDKAGQDYLKTMMGDLGYEVVNDIESLPRRLPSLYKRLTT